MAKRFFSGAVAAAIIMSSLTGCSNAPKNVASYNGGEIPAGVYIYTQHATLNNYQNYMGGGDILNQKIEEKKLSQIITEDSKDAMKRYAAVESECARLNISLTEEDELQAVANTAEVFDAEKETLEGKGISKDSILKLNENNVKSYKLFEAYYGIGGEQEVPKEELEKYITDTYRKATAIEFPMKDKDGKALTGDALAAKKKLAQDYFKEIEGGRDFFEVYKEYYTKEGKEFAPGETEKGSSIIMKITDTRLPKEYVMKVFTTTEQDKPFLFETDDFSIIYKVYDILENDFAENVRSNVVYEMRNETFREDLLKKSETLEFKFDDSALSAYKIEKIAKR